MLFTGQKSLSSTGPAPHQPPVYLSFGGRSREIRGRQCQSVCQSLGQDRWLVEINSHTQHHPFCEQMNLLWQSVYEWSGDLLPSYLNILPSHPQAHCYLWQLGPTLLCALMFNSRTHNQRGRRAWVCWELTGAQELRNSDFRQIFPVLLTPVPVIT